MRQGSQEFRRAIIWTQESLYIEFKLFAFIKMILILIALKLALDFLWKGVEFYSYLKGFIW